ncbi:uncharacterized protein LOC127768322 isoform X1 [Oryza glaberrima]|uniref:uncharacterized protein LOC127768322 isoform X1 n=1 Tax=Oryza glaberrima TaxID=4538 RepID=UPI00224C34AB|nr:uncharacterized protein LOC127768322 isoform X1 [Oryza glaberrima]
MVLGKIVIVIGSGIVGTLLTSGEAKIALPDFRDVLSGAFKFVTKQDKKDGPSTSSPHAAHLLSQVNHLREDLQLLSRSNQVAIVTVDGRPGPGAYGITAVVAGAIGYLYIRWKVKGWKLSDLMFVTKRGLSDACDVVGKQLEHVSENVNAAKRHLAGRIDHVDCTLDECQEITESTRKEVTVIHEDISAFQEEMQSVHLVVRTLETKLGRLAYTQDRTARGIYDLCEFTKRLDKSPKTDTRQVLSSTPLPAIESPERITRAASLPPSSEPEFSGPRSPVTEASKVVHSPTTMSASGLSMLVETSMPPKRGVLSRASSMKEGSQELSNGSSSSGEPTIGRNVPNSRLFGGFGFLKSSAS